MEIPNYGLGNSECEDGLMTVGKAIKGARVKKGVKAYELAELIGRSPAVMSDIEQGKLKGGVSSEILIRIAAALNAPEILLHHCQQCPIRQHIMLRHYPELNNIRKDPASIVAKMRKEMQEAIDAADKLGEKYLKIDFKNDPEYQRTFTEAMEQILDVERVIETLKFELVLNQVHSQEEMQQVIDNQQQKCIDHGHHKPIEERRRQGDRRTGTEG